MGYKSRRSWKSICPVCTFCPFPMTSVLLLARVKRRLNKKAGINSGHLIPLVPQISSFWWPFGLFGLFSQRNPEHIHIPSRRQLEESRSQSLQSYCFRSSLILAGLMMTPSTPPTDLSTAPLVYYGSVAPNLASSLLSDLISRLGSNGSTIGLAGCH